ncbi:DUF2147 domain-containing protein [Tenacibaculum sp. IB213877]|uniref:DUF2147 domain-containing protein n=1 Tax=Tenacibaculum sp. IB213877 TaxID=3097351 RepID=UPI002A5A3C8F|nr:DUF2147 domain-containing protein [Tenacibaculum sp. IB213877]MDY0781496.1 DUF2147 domain-containing protein [Tenacibaculum sp. IB213877]
MKKLILTACIFTISLSINAQTIFGKWENRDEESGKVNSVIEVYEKDGKAFAKIVEITNPERKDAVCDKCDGDNKNKPILGMDILTGLEKDGSEWSGGEILDPKKGKVYKCFIELQGKNKLKVRGYLGVSLFGRTVYWHRKS